MECLLASAVLAIAVAALAQTVSIGQKQTQEALRGLRAMELASALMEQICGLPYDDPDGVSTLGPESGETTRSRFDNVDDYHGYTEARGSLADSRGTAYPQSYQEFSRSVTGAAQTLNITGLSAVTGLSITVTVTDRRGQRWTLTRFVPDPDQ